MVWDCVLVDFDFVDGFGFVIVCYSVVDVIFGVMFVVIVGFCVCIKGLIGYIDVVYFVIFVGVFL